MKRCHNGIGEWTGPSNVITRIYTLDDMLDIVLARIIEICEADSGAVYLYHNEFCELRTSRGVSPHFLEKFSILDPNHPFVKIWARKRSVLEGWINKDGKRARWISVPLPCNSRIIGFMLFVAKGQGSIEKVDVDFLSRLGTSLGATIGSVLNAEMKGETGGFTDSIYNAAEILLIFNKEGKIFYWEPGMNNLVGQLSESVSDRRFSVETDDIRDDLLEAIGKVMIDGSSIPSELIFYTGRNPPYKITIGLIPLSDRSGDPVALSCSLKELERTVTEEGGDFRKERVIKFLSDIIPLLLRRGIPQEEIDVIVPKLSRGIEDLLYDEFFHGEEIDAALLAEKLALFFSGMGGEFLSEVPGDGTIKIICKKCPWNNDIVKNPALCALTASICARFTRRALGPANVSIEKTLANGGDCCSVVISLPAILRMFPLSP